MTSPASTPRPLLATPFTATSTPPSISGHDLGTPTGTTSTAREHALIDQCCTSWEPIVYTGTMKAIAYRRVSTDEQVASGNGLDAQADALDAAIAGRGWELVDTYTDEGRSGGNLRRPALLDALDRLDRGEADVLIASKLDRVARSSLDFASLMDRAKRRGWRIVVLDADVDTTCPSGELMATVVAAFAQYERRLIAARTSDAMQAMKSRGVRLGRPVDLPDDVRNRIAAERAAGKSLRAIVAELDADNVPTARGTRWYASTVRAVLASLDLDAEALAVTA